jgi:hypothetical protein|tara:strand:+ start:2456 stop:2893 length:438 start_codon:yes stop_codon:yes gene_type:complete
MAEKRTDRSKYKSPSTGDYCTTAQYIAELMCQRMAENSNEGSLAYKFWNTEKWKGTFTQQVVLANRLLKNYDERAVIRALRSKRGSKIYSLRFPALSDLIESEQSGLEKELSRQKTIDVTSHNSKVIPKPFGKRSGINKLRDLDE